MIFTLSLVTFIIFVLLLGIIAYFKVRKKRMSVKFTHFMLGIYGGVLILSMIFALIILDPEVAEQKESPVLLYDVLGRGDFSAAEEFLTDEAEFSFSGDRLTVKADYYTIIFVEKSSEAAGKIFADVYGAPLIVEGYNFSEKLLPPKIKLDGNNLTVSYPERQKINIVLVKSDFVVKQFFGKSSFLEDLHFDSPVVYMKVPENIEIDESENVAIEYVSF